VVAVIPYLGWSAELQRPLLASAAVLLGIAALRSFGKEVGKRLRRA
jgi:hypothetical protein